MDIPALSTPRMVKLVISVCAAVAVSACAASLARNAVPANLADQAEVAAAPGVRHWGDAPLKDVAKMARTRRAQVLATRPGILRKRNHTIKMLA
ncbi:MAG: hypothetical protein AAFR60_09570, partial [Pseudomonadota bacterium]